MADERVTYELGGWRDGVRHELASALREVGIEHEWNGTDLIVAKTDERRADRFLDAFEEKHPFEASATKDCPYCGEEIKRVAVLCRHCGAEATSAGWVRPGARLRSPEGTSGLAVASLVLGILWIWWIGSLLALIFGYMAKRDIRRSNGALAGDGLATAGIVLGWIGFAAIGIGVFLVALSASQPQ